MTVLDLSNNDLSTLDPECFRENGVTGVICGVFSRTDAPNQMRVAAQRCRDAGLTIHGFYGLIYFGSPFGEMRDVRWAIQLALEFGVQRVWLDCETDGLENGFTDAHVPSQGERVAAIRRAVAMVREAGLSPGIYSGSWWWPHGTGDSTEFSDLPLWNSYYDQDPDIDGLPYGGWTTAAVEQYSSTIFLCGRARDHNHIYESEDDMTQEQAAKLDAIYDALVGRWNTDGVKRLKDWNAKGNSLLDGYTIEQLKLAGHTHNVPVGDGWEETDIPDFPVVTL